METLKSDRGSSSGRFGMYFFGFIVGSVLEGVIWYHNGYVTGRGDQNHARNLQLQNEQVQTQLAAQYTDVNKLVLNDSEKTLIFGMTDTSGVAETCTGKYEVTNSVASIVGNLSCSQVVIPTPQPTK